MTSKLVTLMCAICALAACGDSPPPRQANPSMRDMPQMQDPATEVPSSASQVHVAQGTINRIDREGGRVNITHDPVESAQWPGMTMDFELADPAAATNVKQGQKVTFHFTLGPGGRAVVSRIDPQG